MALKTHTDLTLMLKEEQGYISTRLFAFCREDFIFTLN